VNVGSGPLTPAQEAKLNEISVVKQKTDLLNFTGTDVKATLDGEEVVTHPISEIQAGLAKTIELNTVETNILSEISTKATKSNQQIINNGVKKSSKLQPHSEDVIV
jgi:allophanate hydrolase subunit 2